MIEAKRPGKTRGMHQKYKNQLVMPENVALLLANKFKRLFITIRFKLICRLPETNWEYNHISVGPPCYHLLVVRFQTQVVNHSETS